MRNAAAILMFAAACSGSPEEVLTCDQAVVEVAACTTLEEDGECSEASPAVRTLASGECDGKSDIIGNRVWGDACTFDFQCQASTDHTCIQGACYRRAETGNQCDKRDDDDCARGLRCADDLSVPNGRTGLCQATSTPVRPALFAETPRQNEDREFQEHAADIMTIQMETAIKKLSGDDRIRRTFHPKKHACVVGNFEVLGGTGELQTGPVFGRPQAFPAYVRLSNGTLAIGADSGATVQGLAIKLVGVPGQKILEGSRDAVTQDFLMVNLPAIPQSNANEFMEFTKAQHKGGTAVAHYLLTHPRIALRVAPLALKKNASVRTESYWAGNASKHGNVAVKYSAVPCAGTPAATTLTGDHYLRAELKPHLAAGNVCFDMFAQKQRDAVAQSIEDASIEWKLGEAPAVRIARLTIPATALDTPATNAVEATCDALSFNPWNSASDYRPLGNVNRSRKHAYEASRQMRGATGEPRSIP